MPRFVCQNQPIRMFPLVALILFALTGTVAGAGRLDWLDEAASVDADTSSAPDAFEVVVFLENENLRHSIQASSGQTELTRAARIKKVCSQLRSYQPTNSAAIRQFVTQHSVSQVAEMWVVPAFVATLSESDIRTLDGMAGVGRIVPDLAVEPILPVETRDASASAASSASHHALLNLPYLWNLGLTGEGRLVCSFDTGVRKDHPALSGNWRGNTAGLSASWFSTVAPASEPYDKADHGTHTMGTICGVDGADTIGAAPGAEWITAGVIDQGKSLSATFSDILLAFQWALDPDGDTTTTNDVPDVILNSWGVPASLFDPCDQTFFAAIDNVEAAGIVCIFSAGNEGPTPSSLRNPASRASSPLNSFAIGAVDNNKVVADFSSRGPGGCGFGAIKPEIVAPGVGVRSASSAGGYKTMSGTSMAAPFIAGMVAICRQYNPNATVEEIKWALINSAEDLGPQGEDNAYGYGLPNGARILNYLSDPETPHFRLAAAAISDDGLAMPGEQFDLRLTVSRTSGSLEQVIGRLIVDGTYDVTIPGDSANYVYGVFGTTALSTKPYQVNFGQNLTNGATVVLALEIRDDLDNVYDTLQIVLPVGYAPVGSIASSSAGGIEFTVSDFGQYGLAPGSIYNIGGRGFTFDGTGNLLYEAGIILGRSPLQLSSSVRDDNGAFRPSDFTPSSPLTERWSDQNQALSRSAVMSDAVAEISIPISVSQTTTYFAQENIVILRFQLVNTSLSTLNEFYFGFLADFDLPGDLESIDLDSNQGLLIQQDDAGPAVGLLGLNGLTGYKSLENPGTKLGLTQASQFQLISTPSSLEVSSAPDLMTLISGGPFLIGPGDSVEVALALMAGTDSLTINYLAARSRELYQIPTSVDDPYTSLPAGYNLAQNYPNPFNPATTIALELPVAAEVSLEIFNLLGQTVRRLHTGYLSSGNHEFIWDARTDDGAEVASGVYFYRLSAGENSQSRKMVLLR